MTYPDPAAGPSELTPPAGMLSAAKAEAVRFESARPGYKYAQVEAFVDQVLATLSFWERLDASRVAQVNEMAAEVEMLTETVNSLKTTVEVFRVKGDAVTASDGSYLTESKVAAVEASEVVALQEALAAANARIAQLESYVEADLKPWALAQAQDAEAATARATAADESLITTLQATESILEMTEQATAVASDLDERIAAAVAEAAAAAAGWSAAPEEVEEQGLPRLTAEIPVVTAEAVADLPAEAPAAPDADDEIDDDDDDFGPWADEFDEPAWADQPRAAAPVEQAPAVVEAPVVEAPVVEAPVGAAPAPAPAPVLRPSLADSPELAAMVEAGLIPSPALDRAPAPAPAPVPAPRRPDLLISSPEAQAARELLDRMRQGRE